MSRLVDALGTGVVRRAVLEVVIVGLLAGAVGAHVLVRRLSFYVVAMSHATFPGVVVAALAGAGIVAGAAVAGLLVTVLIVVAARRAAIGTSTSTGVMLAGAFAVGLVIQSAGSGGSRELSAFLIGSVLTVTVADVVVTVAVALAVAAVLAGAHKELVFTAFDPVGARAVGYHTAKVDAIAMAAVLAVVIVALPAVGALLATALAIVPALTARALTKRLVPAMMLGALLGALAGVLGVAVSILWPVAAGAAVVLTSGAGFVVAVVARGALDAWRRRGARAAAALANSTPVGSPA